MSPLSYRIVDMYTVQTYQAEYILVGLNKGPKVIVFTV